MKGTLQMILRAGLACFCLAVQLCAAAGGTPASQDKPFLESELIFPLEHWHNHASCILECPNGSLLVCWYHGSGERTADDVVVLGARKPKGARQWTTPFLMADTPGYPDTNPAMFIDPQKRLWLLWATILANRWETALLKYRISADYQKSGPPRWNASEVLHVTPGTNFQAMVNAALDELAAGPRPAEKPAEFEKWIQEARARAADKLSCRLGWMPRAHPCILEGKRLIVPLYSDGFDFSIMAISDDWGRSWFTSTPLVGLGNVQPSLARKRDGTLVAFMRDNGPAPHRIQLSESTDRGESWSRVVDSDRLDPGAGVEVLVLRNGLWLLINNDLEKGRHSLAVSLSEDEGRTWKWTRHLERDTETDIKTGAGSYHYPSVIQARDETLHVSYSFHQKKSETPLESAGRPASESIKHAHFNEAWIRQGDAR
jgi:predicted neuraminidase